MVVAFDPSVLLAYYQAKAGIPANSSSTGGTTGTGATKPTNPTPPWSSTSTAPPASDLTKSVLNGGPFIDESAAKLDVPGASSDYKRLFAVYQGLSALNGLAQQMTTTGLSAADKAQIQSRFAAGLQEVGSYVDKTSFDAFQLALNTPSDKAQSTVGVKTETDTYTTGPLWSGDANAPVDAFQGPVAFTMTATKKSGPVTVSFDLDEMGNVPRTMSNVAIYMNQKLQQAGLFTRVGVVRNAGADRTTTAGGQTIKLGTDPDSFSLQIKGVETEALSFAAPDAKPAVYIGETVGTSGTTTTTTSTSTTSSTSTTGSSPAATSSDLSTQLVKFQTDPSANATSAVDGKVFASDLGPEVTAVRASAVGPDGSLYVLADVNGTTDGQTIKGSSDVALKKYDSTGQLVYTRTLGAADDAAGYALAVSADGSRVAIAGSVTGALDNGDTGSDASTADSFVTVFNGDGDQLWTQRDAAAADDHVTGVAFGADGTLYATGDTSSAMPGAHAVGGQDIFVQSFTPNTAKNATEAYKPGFTTQYGTANLDKAAGIAVSGSSLYAAGVENGHAVVRRYDLQATGAPTLGAVRDLGALQGGGVAGISVAADGSVIVAGSTHNGALDAGTATTPYSGSGQAAFVARLSAGVSPAAGDKVTYLNGTSDLTASAMTVSGGQVYLTGQQTAPPPPGQTAAFDGYAAAIDPTTGQVSWSQTFRGTDRTAAPSTIAVAQTGASVLDRLGLPNGAIDYTGSDLLVANTSVRAGDQFQVQVNGGLASTVTIEANDTLDTLATKVGRASGFTATVSVVTTDGQKQLKITPMNDSTSIVLSAGKTGRDALGALGLSEGLITTAPDPDTKDQVNAHYGLGLPTTLSLATDADVKQAQKELSTAMSMVQTIYSNMVAPPPSAASASSGTVPAYLTAQIQNYQQALERLTGSSTGTTT